MSYLTRVSPILPSQSLVAPTLVRVVLPPQGGAVVTTSSGGQNGVHQV